MVKSREIPNLFEVTVHVLKPPVAIVIGKTQDVTTCQREREREVSKCKLTRLKLNTSPCP